MGVPGLWDILRPAATRHSLSHLAREAVLKNNNNLRALTIGIDASIWIFHAQIPHHGENPFLRTMFYKITALLQQPVLPVFVFDGPDKPGRKRNQRVAGSFGTSDSRSRQFKELLDECGLEWWNAPGEAEAELAVMNRQGKIDAVLSDDVDALLFGALCLLRNNSPTLSGASSSSTTKSDLRSYDVYSASAIRDLLTSKDGTKLATDEDCRLAMVLVALLAGGDYVPEGVDTFGPTIALGLAHAGFVDLLKLYKTDQKAFQTELSFTLGRMVEELRTDASGMISRKNPARAKALSQLHPDSVFSKYALDAYLKPSTSPLGDKLAGWPGFVRGERSIRRGKARNGGRGDLEGFARACERFFEWGTKDIVKKKFASESVGLYAATVMDSARGTMQATSQSEPSSFRTKAASPSAPQSSSGLGIAKHFQEVRNPVRNLSSLQSKQSENTPPTRSQTPPSSVGNIVSTRPDPTDPDITEYRLSFMHEIYSNRVLDSMEGIRLDPKELDAEMRAELGLKDRQAEEVIVDHGLKDELRMWIPDYLIKGAWPGLVTQYDEKLKAKIAKKAPKKTVATGKPAIRVRSDQSAVGVNRQAFKEFFTQETASRSIRPNASQRQCSLSSSDSDVEVVGVVGAKSPKPRSNRRQHPTSSISSPPSSPRLAAKTPSPRKTRLGKARVSTRRSKSPNTIAIRTAKIQSEVIDLCSSEDETPKARRSAAKATAVVTSPRDEVRRQPRSTKKKSKQVHSSEDDFYVTTSSQLIQTRLDLPVLGPSSLMILHKSTTTPRRSPRTAQNSKGDKYRYREISASEDEIVIDTTGTMEALR